MSLRNADVTDPQATRRLEMRRVVFADDSIIAVWYVKTKGGMVRDERVEVSRTLQANIEARPSHQNMLDQIRDDTKDRIPT